MKVISVKQPTNPKVLEKLISEMPDLFNGENIATPDEINELIDNDVLTPQQIELAIKKGLITVEAEKLETETPKDEEIVKLDETVKNRAIVKIDDFTFLKMPNSKKVLTAIPKLQSRTERAEAIAEYGLKDCAAMLLNFTETTNFGSAVDYFNVYGISSAKGTKSLFILANDITDEETYETLKKTTLKSHEYLCEEYRLRDKAGNEVKELNFPVDLDGNVETVAYRCFGVINQTTNKTAFHVLKYDEKKNRFSLNCKLFSNLAEFNTEIN